MVRISILALLLVACSPTLHKVSLVNKTPRTIEEVFIYPAGSTNHGASRAKLAPNASAVIDVKAGNIEVLAVSEKIIIDEHTRDKPQASQTLELKGPLEVVFHDSDAVPAGADKPGTRAIAFRKLPAPAPPPEDAPPAEAPAP